MKNGVLAVAVALGTILGTSVVSAKAETEQSSCKPSLWIEIQKLAKIAVNEPARNENLDVLDRRTARVRVANREFKIELYESELADYGDLNDVVASEIDGDCQIELLSVPSHGDLMEALGVNRPDFTIEDVEFLATENS